MKLSRLSGLVLLLCLGQAVAAEQGPDWANQRLTGDWDGARNNWYNKGVSLDVMHKSDVLGIVSGGLKDGTVWMGHTQATLDLDLEKLMGWSGGAAHVHYHSQLGSKFNRDYVGAFMGVSNAEAQVNTGQFFQIWLEQQLLDQRLSLLAGLYSVDADFYVTNTSLVFMQPPYEMANEVSQTGVNGPAVFPTGALGARVKYTPPGYGFYAQAAITDGVPGDPNNPRGTHAQLNDGDGSFVIGEMGANLSSGGKVGLGAWRYSNEFNDLVDARTRKNQGVYFLLEGRVASEKARVEQGVDGFFRFGTASKDVNQVDWSTSFGLVYTGMLESRDVDKAALAITVNHASDKYQRINNSEGKEVQFEASYRAQLYPWLALQPTLQYIKNPNMSLSRKDVWLTGFRTEVKF